jgi:hypothetical protein
MVSMAFQVDPYDLAHPEHRHDQHHDGEDQHLLPRGVLQQRRQIVRRREPEDAEQDDGHERQDPGREAPLGREGAHAAAEAEAAADHLRDALENLGKVAAGFLLDQHGSHDRHETRARHAHQEAQKRPPQVVAVVHVRESQLELAGNRLVHVLGNELQAGVERVPGAQRPLHHVDGIRQLLLELLEPCAPLPGNVHEGCGTTAGHHEQGQHGAVREEHAQQSAGRGAQDGERDQAMGEDVDAGLLDVAAERFHLRRVLEPARERRQVAEVLLPEQGGRLSLSIHRIDLGKPAAQELARLCVRAEGRHDQHLRKQEDRSAQEAQEDDVAAGHWNS